MATEKRIKFAGDVFDALMKKGWSCTDAANFLNSFPDADAVEVVHGRWIRRHNETKCSKCQFIYYSNHYDYNYCPNCGAKMDGGSHETD